MLKKIIITSSTLLLLIEIFLMAPQKGMSSEWSTAYFSGAVELKSGFSWHYDLNQVDMFKRLTDYEIYTYNFDGINKHLVEYNLNNTGFLYVVYLSNLFIPILGPLGSVVFIQILLHILISISIIGLFNESRNKILFLLLYTLNPLVVYFTLFPYYYFWQVLPSAILIIILLKSKINLLQSLAISIVLVISYAIRPTTTLIIIFTLGILLHKLSPKIRIYPVILFLLLLGIYQSIFNMTKGISPWHTAFVGIGAYPNPYPYLPDLSDNNGYKRFEQVNGVRVDASADGNYQRDDKFRASYLGFLKKEHLTIFKEHPMLLVRNAVLNFATGFSVGYHQRFSWYMHLMIAFSGLVVIIILLRYKEYLGFLAISISHITFTPYFPPIYAYYFGTIILLVFFGIIVLNKILNRERL